MRCGPSRKNVRLFERCDVQDVELGSGIFQLAETFGRDDLDGDGPVPRHPVSVETFADERIFILKDAGPVFRFRRFFFLQFGQRNRFFASGKRFFSRPV